MNRRRIAIGISSVSGLAVAAVGATNMFSSGDAANTVNLHAAPVAAVTAAGVATGRSGTAQVDTLVTATIPAVPAYGATPAAAARTTTTHGTGLFDFGRQIGRIDLTLANGSVQEVLTPTSLYWLLAAPAPNAARPAKGWSRVDVAASPDGTLYSGGATDPAMAFAMLAGAQHDVKYVGQDQVRGEPVAHYHGTLDLQQAATAPVAAGAGGSGVTAADAAADKKALANAARAFATPKIPFDAYLDAQGRLRRFVAAFSVTMPGPAKAVAQVTSATELFGFGTPVTVVTPSVAPATTPAAHPSSPKRAHK
ncbi:MAG: hypothetical protein JF587_01605 [Catenulisporales bacterium]|nr:hypothetical protein [Catenulisporales bacterium]